MASTSDTGCVVIVGGGWGPPPTGAIECSHSAHTGDSGSSAGARLEGTPCGCASASPSAAALWIVVVVLLRRVGWLALLLVLPGLARAVDVEHLDPDANPGWLALRDGDLGEPWSARFAVTGSLMRAPAVLRSADGEEELLSLVGTVTGALAVNIDIVQVQVVAPFYPLVLAPGVRAAGPGDVGVRVSVPLVEASSPVRLSWTAAADAATGDRDHLLGENGTVWGALAADAPLGEHLRAGFSAGVQLRQPVQIPGSVWGRALELGGGLSWRAARFAVNAEAFGQLGLETPNPATFPLELLLSGRLAAGERTGVRVAAGGGLGRGLGNPAWRLAVALDATLATGDRDGDRRPDLRDLCPRRPEDLDRFRDLEGCPDPDNDHDGLLDPVDACPLDAEVVNGWSDEDGCPDALARLTLRLAADVDNAEVAVDGAVVAHLFGGEDTTVEIVPGPHRLQAAAEGFVPLDRAEDVPEGKSTRELRLEPVPRGRMAVRVRDERGAPLEAAITVDGAPAGSGSALDLPHPPGVALVRADRDAYLSAAVEVIVPQAGDVPVELVLRPVAIARVGQELVLGDEIGFPLDDATVRADDPLLDLVAQWLRDHPEVRLLRIEGFADEVGTPAYNLALSVRRAQAVRAALVARGIAPERLEAIGTGESRAGRGPARAVGFLVLVWEE